MRRILTTLGITALVALLATPAMARPRGSNAPTPAATNGWVAGARHDGMRVEHVAPAPYIAPAKLRRAKALRNQYIAQKARLMQQIRAEKRLIRSLEAKPFHNRARVRANLRRISAAEFRLRKLELKLSSLELMYQTRIAQLMSPVGVRYFQMTYG
ncbi:MAG: hypothetical protein EP329_22075 [Deltaproteobacteria bacterium]|nr:MAG: hypothetical protein EP329_22075 [Deltaproteobacteria bacterium]